MKLETKRKLFWYPSLVFLATLAGMGIGAALKKPNGRNISTESAPILLSYLACALITLSLFVIGKKLQECFCPIDLEDDVRETNALLGEGEPELGVVETLPASGGSTGNIQQEKESNAEEQPARRSLLAKSVNWSVATVLGLVAGIVSGEILSGDSDPKVNFWSFILFTSYAACATITLLSFTGVRAVQNRQCCGASL